MLLGVSTTHYRDRFDPAVRAHPGEKAGIPALLQPAGIYSEAVLKAFAYERSNRTHCKLSAREKPLARRFGRRFPSSLRRTGAALAIAASCDSGLAISCLASSCWCGRCVGIGTGLAQYNHGLVGRIRRFGCDRAKRRVSAGHVRFASTFETRSCCIALLCLGVGKDRPFDRHFGRRQAGTW